MNLLSLIQVEFQKIRRSKIMLILIIAAIIMWIPAMMNGDMNFNKDNIGITPENNFLIQGFLGMAWFMFPASMVVSTVLLHQTERKNRGILKMLSLPIRRTSLCIAKFIVLLVLSVLQIAMTVIMYYISAMVVSKTQNYDFILPFSFVAKEAALILVSGMPMLTVFWLLSILIETPIFSIGIGLTSIVPSVLIINTKIWFAYPMAYPFFVITSEYGKLSTSMSGTSVDIIPFLPTAIGIAVVCLLISCLRFGQSERK